MKDNPFVGPVPIERRSDEFGKPVKSLYGRDVETDQLCKLLIAERIVLLYSPSGAGKTSLIQAGLIPRLEEEDFRLFPLYRPGRTEPADKVEKFMFVQSLLANLQLDPMAAYRDGGLAEELQRRFESDGARAKDAVLIFDQFERLVTADVRFEEAVHFFFKELSTALSTKKFTLWILISIREDYIALLDPYLPFFPNALRARYRLNLLTPEEARMAIEEPAKKIGVPFKPEAISLLVSNLRTNPARAEEGRGEIEGYIDPIQLQVVCLALWDKLPEGTRNVEKDEIPSIDAITSCLADHYSSKVALAAKASNIAENVIRDWFERSLIDSRGFRIPVSLGPTSKPSVNLKAIESLQEGYLIQEVRRATTTLYELTHDRFVEPVRRSNRWWRIDHLDEFQKRAREWEQEAKPSYLLYRKQQFQDADHWVRRHQPLAPLEEEFWKACLVERESVKLRASIRLLVALASVLLFTLTYAVLRFTKQWDHSLSRRFAVVASSNVDNDPERGILLGVVGAQYDLRKILSFFPFHSDPIESETRYALNSSLQGSRLSIQIEAYPDKDRVYVESQPDLDSVAFAPDSKELAISDLNGDGSSTALRVG